MLYTVGSRAFVVGAMASAVVAGATSAASAQELNATEKALMEAAKKEGAVTIIHPLFADRTGLRMAEDFKKRYGLGADFKFNSLRKGTGATVSQVRQEIQAGKHTVDLILVSSPGFFDEASKRGAFLPLDSVAWKDNEELVKKAGQYSNYPTVVTPLAYSFVPVWNTSCPGMKDVNITSYADALDPKLKGKTIASDVTKSFTYTNTVLALEEGGVMKLADLWAKLKATDPIIEFRTEPKMQMVISCQRPIDMWNIGGRVYQNVLKKPELAKDIKIGTYKEGQVLLGNQVAVIKGAPHPNAAKLLVEYLMTKAGADIYVEGEAVTSFLKGYKPPAAAAPYLFDLEKVKLIGMKDWVGAAKKFKDTRETWQKTFQ